MRGTLRYRVAAAAPRTWMGEAASRAWRPVVAPRDDEAPTRRSQVTYKRWPLYLYEQDAAPGEVEGQGDTMGLWYVIAADGAVDRNDVFDRANE